MQRLQSYVTNQLPDISGPFAALVGDHPSVYARSPALWNAAFRAVGIDAVYLPLDVSTESLPALMTALRRDERFLGGNVTVPHKARVLRSLDDVDPPARLIGAVNTVVRTPEGRLTGYNTDGRAAVASLRGEASGEPLCEDLAGRTILLIGAGGAAWAVASALAEVMQTGRIIIINRSVERARDLVRSLQERFRLGEVAGDDDLDEVAPECDLVINASIKGQAGLWRKPEGITWLEPYSALAPARPAMVAEDSTDAALYHALFEASVEDIRRNHARSMELVSGFRRAAFFDLIYAPAETTMLRHARWTGYRTANGRWMNILQAADAFTSRVCRPLLEPHRDLGTVRRLVIQAMHEAW